MDLPQESTIRFGWDLPQESTTIDLDGRDFMRWNPWFPTTGPRDVPVDPSRCFVCSHIAVRLGCPLAPKLDGLKSTRPTLW